MSGQKSWMFNFCSQDDFGMSTSKAFQERVICTCQLKPWDEKFLNDQTRSHPNTHTRTHHKTYFQHTWACVLCGSTSTKSVFIRLTYAARTVLPPAVLSLSSTATCDNKVEEEEERYKTTMRELRFWQWVGKKCTEGVREGERVRTW